MGIGCCVAFKPPVPGVAVGRAATCAGGGVAAFCGFMPGLYFTIRKVLDTPGRLLKSTSSIKVLIRKRPKPETRRNLAWVFTSAKATFVLSKVLPLSMR